MTKFVNCTPHAITVEGLGTLQPSGILPRVATIRSPQPTLGGVRLIRQWLGAVEGLPTTVDGVVYIVSALVLAGCKGRADVVAPDTGPDAIRDNGQIVAVKGFVQ